MTDAEYVEHELRKALREGPEPVETVRIKAEGPYGDSRWVSLGVAEFEKLITATTDAVTERGDRS